MSNHEYFDPSIFFQDEEMRKQIEGLANAFCWTGQESPETAKRIFLDLFKKMMSADGIAGRRPYGICTVMFNLIGWKRMEVNKMMYFHGVTLDNFDSVLRRSLVWEVKCRFFNRALQGVLAVGWIWLVFLPHLGEVFDCGGGWGGHLSIVVSECRDASPCFPGGL